MPSRRHRPRRLLLPTVLAAVLAAEITGIALARTIAPAAPAVAASAPAAVTAPAVASAAPGAGKVVRATDPAGTAAAESAVPAATVDRTTIGLRPTVAAAPARLAKVRTSSPTTHRSTPATTRPQTTSAAYRGVNHVWIPSLGINKGVQSFPCSRSRPPDAGVYRWGCAGRNNIYLLSHAWSTFKPLHDAYVGGRLHKGMKVVYADGGGHVHTYSVTWWRVVAPTTAASWAWAALSRPSMTLQTCVGAKSAYRLMVRLTRVA